MDPVASVYHIFLMLFSYPAKDLFTFSTVSQFLSFLSTFLYLAISIGGTVVFIIFTTQYLRDKEYMKKTILTSIYYGYTTIIALFGVFVSFILPKINVTMLQFHGFELNEYPFQQLLVFLLFIQLLIKTFSTLNKVFSIGNIIWIVYMFMIKDWSCLYILLPIVFYHLGGHLYFYYYHEVTSFKWMIGTEIVLLITYLFGSLKTMGSYWIVFGIMTVCEIVNFGTTAGITYGLYESNHQQVSNMNEEQIAKQQQLLKKKN